jgi:hypothetical protein
MVCEVSPRLLRGVRNDVNKDVIARNGEHPPGSASGRKYIYKGCMGLNEVTKQSLFEDDNLVVMGR